MVAVFAMLKTLPVTTSLLRETMADKMLMSRRQIKHLNKISKLLDFVTVFGFAIRNVFK